MFENDRFVKCSTASEHFVGSASAAECRGVVRDENHMVWYYRSSAYRSNRTAKMTVHRNRYSVECHTDSCMRTRGPDERREWTDGIDIDDDSRPRVNRSVDVRSVVAMRMNSKKRCGWRVSTLSVSDSHSDAVIENRSP